MPGGGLKHDFLSKSDIIMHHKLKINKYDN